MKHCGVAAALLALVCAPVWAVNKCTAPDGKVTYQAQPCPVGGNGAVLGFGGRPWVVEPSPESLSPIKNHNQADSFAPRPPPQGAATSATPATASASAWAGEAQSCLSFIQPMLKDPGSPYVQDVRKEGSVLSMNLFAKNSFGGYTSKAAACEIKNGQLDVGWTNIHLKRLGWFAE